MRLSSAVLAVALLVFGAARPQLARQTPPTAGDDLIAVDVEAIDATGHPVVGLTPDQFDLTLDGQPRRVVSAQFVGLGGSDAAVPAGARDRLFVLAVDLASFSPIESIGMIVSAQGFVDRIPGNERIAVVTYPEGTTTEPTTDRVAIRRALETLVGRRPNAPPPGARSVAGPDPPSRSAQTIEELPNVFERIRPLPGRKIVVLVSPGTGTASATPDDRELIAVARQAAQAGVIVYTLLVDAGFIDVTIPEKERPIRSAAQNQPAVAHEQWLGELSGLAGGWLVIAAGLNPEPAYDRLLDETSGYYVLGVEAAGLNPDRQPYELSVKVKQEGIAVRTRRWATPAGPTVGRPSPAAADAPGRSSPAGPAAPRAVSADPILAAFERGEYATTQERLTRTSDLARWIRDFRDDKPPWPETPRRAAVFALEVAAVALSDRNAAVREEAVRLLVGRSGALPPAQTDGNFTCAWYWAALMLFEGSEEPDAAREFISRALSRCPNEPRIVLASAVLADLRTPVLTGTLRVGSAAAAEDAAHQAVMAAYRTAMTFPENETEARVRIAWRLLRLKRFDEAFGLIEQVRPGPLAAPDDVYRRQIDQQVRYLGHLVQGHVLRALDRVDQAAAAYRLAIEDWPSAQAPRLSLMTLVGTHGRGAEAAALAADIELAPDDATDPWWWFWQGDRQLFPALIARLREDVR